MKVINADVIDGLRTLPDASVHCCVTSPPYWGLRDYGHDGQIGLEPTPEAYVARMAEVFREVRRVLRDDGTLWLNLGDSYAGSTMTGGNKSFNSSGGENGFKQKRQFARPATTPNGLKPKDLVGIPWRVAFALQADGWYLRQDIIWHKPNPMPESVRDRCTKAHEYVFLLTKSQRYYYDAQAVSEPVAVSTVARLQQPTLLEQGGSDRVPGKTNGPMKAVGPRFGGSRFGDSDDPKYATKSGNVYQIPDANGRRNRRSVWTVTTKPYSGAHFAVMPSDLVEPCIKAGTSEQGCCPECGAPWERVVERESGEINAGAKARGRIEAGLASSKTTLSSGTPGHSYTTGWRPTCTCGESLEPVPCTVLDPFAGSGTTLAVAASQGRNGIGIELNPDYIPLIRQRIDKVKEKAGMFA